MMTRLRSELIENGYCLVDVESYKDFASIAHGLGTTIKITEIRARHGRREKLCSNLPMSLHTDHPSARCVAWYCKQPARVGGSSLLVDVRSVIGALTETDLEELRGLEVKVPPISRTGAFRSRPILTADGVYYADWLLEKSSRKEVGHALARFQKALTEVAPISIQLRENQALFIDNSRVLHGREGYIDGTRSRRLVRHWISG